MNICVDVGNSTINIGVFAEETLKIKLTLTTDVVKTIDEYQNIIQQQVQLKGLQVEDIKNIIFASVVPELNTPLKSALLRVFHKAELISLAPGIKTGLALRVDNPNEVGADLIGDLVGAKEKYGYPVIICDLGTATKVLLIDNKGYFSTALITPGLTISANSLTKNAALLPSISPEQPKTVLAKNTIEAMNAGVVYGHADMILGLAKRIEKEIGYPCKCILTGGNATPLKDIVKDKFIYDEYLILNGLNIILRKNLGK